jgi:hypothetical protein
MPLGNDLEGRPIVYLLCARMIPTETSKDECIKYAAYALDYVVGEKMPANVD